MNRGFSPAPDRPAPVALGIVGICTLLELALTLGGTPTLGGDGMRRTALIYGAFWPRVIDSWAPAWPGQPAAMFFTYAFLHGGVMHLLFNMLILVHLSRETVARVGQQGFVLFYLFTAAGGAAGFWLLSSAPGPMVGASGAVFGLFGATQYWDYQRRRAAGATLRPFWNLLIGLSLMNVALFALFGGYLAWQAHLGGYVAGFVLAWVITPTLRHRFRGFG